MQELRVIGVEDGALLATSDDGSRFRIAIDDALRSRVRQSVPDAGTGRRLAPKDIQAHIRSGMSAEDVASVCSEFYAPGRQTVVSLGPSE